MVVDSEMYFKNSSVRDVSFASAINRLLVCLIRFSSNIFPFVSFNNNVQKTELSMVEQE